MCYFNNQMDWLGSFDYFFLSLRDELKRDLDKRVMIEALIGSLCYSLKKFRKPIQVQYSVIV
jgi:hypothetical protein